MKPLLVDFLSLVTGSTFEDYKHQVFYNPSLLFLQSELFEAKYSMETIQPWAPIKH